MANIHRYRIDWNGLARLIVEVDHDLLTEDKLHVINEFWTEADDRLIEMDDNVLNAVLALLAETCFRLCFQGCFVTSLLIDAFEDGQEGWPRMDGSYGIKIISCEEPEFHVHEMEISHEE